MLLPPKRDLYKVLTSLPEGSVGELLNDQLYARPHPGGRHILIASNVAVEIGGPYYRGKEGPGGWWILLQPEIHLSLDTEVVVPDVVGWRKERMSTIPEEHKLTVVPDWVCEVLSPSTESVGRKIKAPIYAAYGVKHLWLIDPGKQRLETCCLNDRQWLPQEKFTGDDVVSIEPFRSAQFRLKELWN